MKFVSPSVDLPSKTNSGADEVNSIGRFANEAKPSFHALSRDYFANEAPQHFTHETALFLIMMITVAMPLLDASVAVLGLVRI
jgi:hypothetical protein